MADNSKSQGLVPTKLHTHYIELRVHLSNLQKDNLAKQIRLLVLSRRLREGVVRRIQVTPASLWVIVVYQRKGVVHLVAGYTRRRHEPSRAQRRTIRAELGRIRREY